MKITEQLSLKNAYLCGLLMLAPMAMSSALAADLPDLPQAFDAGWNGAKTCEVVYETETVRVGRCSFPPGIGHEKHFHYPHFGYVLAGGTMQITDGNGVVEVRNVVTGSTWSTSEITIHEALNIGDTTTSYLIVEPKYALPEQKRQPE